MKPRTRNVWIGAIALMGYVAGACGSTELDPGSETSATVDEAGSPVTIAPPEPTDVAGSGEPLEERAASTPTTSLGEHTVLDTGLVGVTFEQIGVSTVVPRGWTRTDDGGFGDGTSQLAPFAMEARQATDSALEGFEPVGEITAGGHDWTLFAQQIGGAFVGVAVTEIGPFIYGFVLQTSTVLADSLVDTVVIPALEAFEVVAPPQGADPFDGIEIDNVDLGGLGVAYVAEGVGSPTVVFEAGLGNGMAGWAEVLPEIAKHTRVFAYDRAGYGDSDLTDNPRDAATIVAELHELLTATGHEAPFLLVGHSLGGTLMDLFARTYPDEVVGLVLVDSRHHEFSRRCAAEFGAAACDIPTANEIAGAPRPIREEALALATTEQQLSDAPPFPAIPLAVIVAGIFDSDPAQAQLWRETQQDYADMALGSRLIVAEHSDHGVPGQQPEIIIDTVIDILLGASR